MSLQTASTSGHPTGTGGDSSGQLRRDKHFWFEDGTINIIAGGVEFRVYKGLLTRQSPVFADMFSFPQPKHGRSEHGSPPAGADTIPVVHITDSPHAFRILLSAAGMAPGEKALTFDATHPTCFTLASCVRLGQKYQMNQIVDPCVRYLERYLPTTLQDYDALETLLPPQFGKDLSKAICLVNLARLTGSTDLLPLLLMICSNLRGNTLVTGVKSPDGSIDTLSPDDLARCYDAHVTGLGRTRVKSKTEASDSRADASYRRTGRENRLPSQYWRWFSEENRRVT